MGVPVVGRCRLRLTGRARGREFDRSVGDRSDIQIEERLPGLGLPHVVVELHDHLAADDFECRFREGGVLGELIGELSHRRVDPARPHTLVHEIRRRTEEHEVTEREEMLPPIPDRRREHAVGDEGSDLARGDAEELGHLTYGVAGLGRIRFGRCHQPQRTPQLTSSSWPSWRTWLPPSWRACVTTAPPHRPRYRRGWP